MPILKKEVLYAKEVDDVAVLLVSIVKDVRAGKSAPEIGAGNLTKLMDAIAGIDQMDDEAKANRAALISTIGYRMGELVDAVLPKVTA